MSNSGLSQPATNTIIIVCTHCANPFEVPKKDKHRKFCSHSCSAIFNNKKRGPRPASVRQKIQNTVTSKIPPYSKVSWCKYCNQVIPHKHITVCEPCKNVRKGKKHQMDKCEQNQNLYPKRHHATIKYAAIVLNKPEHGITHADVKKFISTIHDMIWEQQLSPAQIAKHFNIIHTNFGMFVSKCLNIPTRDLKSAVKNTKIQNGTARSEAKDIYYAACEFKFSQQEIVRIPGFELINSIGIYHPIKNPNGAVRDHILSRAEAYEKGYDPVHISHPANCRFITNAENIKKNRNSDITYEQLLERIDLWVKNVVPELCTERRKVDMTPEHIENIRRSIVKRYEDIRSGRLQDSSGNKVRIGRPEAFSKKYDWAIINLSIDQGLSCVQLCQLYGISRDDLMKAKRKGLVKRHPKK